MDDDMVSVDDLSFLTPLEFRKVVEESTEDFGNDNNGIVIGDSVLEFRDELERTLGIGLSDPSKHCPLLINHDILRQKKITKRRNLF